MTFDVDDPRLTAFALGEIPEAERPEIEKALAERPDLALEVEQIRQTATLLTERLHEEQAREAVAAEPLKLVADAPRKPRWFWRRHPWMSGVAALALLGLSTALMMPTIEMAQQRSTQDVMESAPPPAAPAVKAFRRADGAAHAVDDVTIGTPGDEGWERYWPEAPAVAPAPAAVRLAEQAPKLMEGMADRAQSGDQSGRFRSMGGMVRGYGRPAPAPGGRTEALAAANAPLMKRKLAPSSSPVPAAAARARALALAAEPVGAYGRPSRSFDKFDAADGDRAPGQQAQPARDMPMGRRMPEAESAPAPVAVEENPFILADQESTSTFAIDVDTASYSIVRRSLMEQGRLPSPDEVRIEEMLNYFPYQDAPPPAEGPDPFAIHVEAARCPWNASNRLARIGIMGRPIGDEARKPSNLVFLVDVSGSMDQPNKLPLVQWGLQKLVEQLGENDRVAIVVYAGASGLVLPPTSAMDKPTILSRIEELRAGGSTNGGAGIQLAYDQAAAGFINGGINRVILATDGDFNVGVTNRDELVRLVESKAKGEKPIFLTVLGFGMDNLKDGTLETLADKGNGHYAYIDRPEEAHKVLVEEMGATLDVIAKDVKIQVEFNPEQVRAYRLVGYENRVMPNQDFRDDRKDGGEIGAGHHVTALYEYAPAEAAPSPPTGGAPSPAWFTVRLRYKQPEGDAATEIERPVADRGVDYADASDDFKFASAVAGFGMILRHSPSVGSLTLPGVIELATPALAHDPGGYRREFMSLVQKARDIETPPIAAPIE